MAFITDDGISQIVGKICLSDQGKPHSHVPGSFSSNSAVNKMRKEEIVEELRILRLNTKGNKDEISKRLKTYWNRRRAAEKLAARCSSESVPTDRYYDFLCVIDFECTCEEGRNNLGYPHEIIEFPAILLNTKTLEVVDEFHSYCKPIANPTLSKFCTDLTGIKQDQVDAAPPFGQVFENFLAFLRKHDLGTTYRYAFVTDTPTDFGNFLQRQCQQIGIPIPHHMRYWINLRRAYCRFYKQERTSLQRMLRELQMDFDGRMHSGLDDARNIAKIAVQLLQFGCDMRINERLLRHDRFAAAGKDDSAIASGHWTKTIPDEIGQQNDDTVDCSTSAASELSPPTIQQSLPYKVLTISKNEFLDNAYEECWTCDEDEGQQMAA